MSYDQKFYDVIRDGAQRSVAAAMPIIAEQLRLTGSESILDVGCGEGWWADGFARLGCTVIGIDSGTTPHRPESFTYVEADLTGTIAFRDATTDRKPFDLVVSLEVAEHLPAWRASTFISDLCDMSDTVLFSAARPGQGGTGHINEQPTRYWVGKFEDNGFKVSGALRWHMWGNPDIENWYQQNMLVAMREPCTESPGDPGDWRDGATYTLCHPLFRNELLTRPHDVVHPILFNARRST
jgi:SAM-dependent methyltransferase